MQSSDKTTKEALNLYQKALQALSEKKKDAMREYLAQAVALSPELKTKLREEAVFKEFQNDSFFRRIAYPEEEINKGVEMMYQGDFDGAITLFEQLRAKEPQNSHLFFYLSICWFQLGDVQKALEMAEKNIELNPMFPDAYLNKAAALERLAKYEEAVVVYQKALELEPNFENAHYNLAMLFLYNLQKPQEAIASLTTLINLNGKIRNLGLYKRATTYARLNQKELMIQDLSEAIKADPQAKESIKENTDFKPFFEDPDFKSLVTP